MLVQSVGVNLTSLSKVDGADCVEEAGWMVSGGVSHLTTMTGVVEEVHCSWFGDEPVYRCQDVVATRVVWPSHVITENDL